MKLLNHRLINRNSSHNLIFLHGVLGNLRNLTSISTHPFISANFNAYFVDLRNHGNSFWSENNSIAENSADILNFVKEKALKNVTLIGHSLGGKVAIESALRAPENFQALILLDISPETFPPNFYVKSEVFSFVKQLLEIDTKLEGKNLERALNEISKNDAILTGFFMSNVERKKNGSGFSWKANLHAIFNSFSNVYSHEFFDNVFLKPVLEIAGKKSDFVDPKKLDVFNRFFPNMDLKEDVKFVDAKHWVHFEQPKVVNDLIADFLRKNVVFENEK